MEKVKLTKAQAEFLETKMFSYQQDKINVLKSFMDSYFTNGHCFQGVDSDTVARALYNGYEVEKSPEEQIFDVWKSYNSKIDEFDRGYRTAVLAVLSILNIKVKGIND